MSRGAAGLVVGGVAGWLLAFLLLVGEPALIDQYLELGFSGGELAVFVNLGGLFGALLGATSAIVLAFSRPR